MFSKKNFLLGYIIFIGGLIPAQTPLMDSLKKVLPQEEIDKEKGLFHLRQAKEFLRVDPLKSKEQLELAQVSLAKNGKNKDWAEATLRWVELQIKYFGEFDVALQQNNIVADWLTRVAYPKLEADVLLNESFYEYLKNNNLAVALELAQKALKKYEQETLLAKQADCLCHIGYLFRSFRKLEDAERYLSDGITLLTESGLEKETSKCYTGLATIYGIQGNLEKAKELQEKVIKMDEAAGYRAWLSLDYSNLGTTYAIMGNLQEAKKKFEKAVILREEIGDLQDLANSYTNLGQIANDLLEHEASLGYLEKAIFWADSLDQIREKAAAHLAISFTQYNIEEYQAAYDNLEIASDLQDTLFSKEQNRRFAELEVQYQTKEQQNELVLKNEKLRQQQIINGAIGLVVILLLIVIFQTRRIAQQRKQTNNQLRKLDQVKSNFFTNVSHELRTPLTLIIAPLKNAIEKVKNQLVKEDLELAHKNGQQLLNLVNEILDLSKLESGKMTLETKKVQVSNLLQRIFYAYESFAKYKGIDFRLDNALPQQLWALLDIQKFEKILNNLLSNALKYSDSGDQVWMQALVNDTGNLTVTVKDTGSGIATADLPKVFDRYYQSQQKKDNFQGGTGIGLALAKEYTHLFQGDLTVESQLEKGTTFYLNLPLQTTTAEVAVAPPTFTKPVLETYANTYQPQILAKEKPKLLIVEDHREMSQFLLKTLAPFYHCTPAYNGIEALEKLQTNRFDLITSDVMMPQMDGFTLLEKIHQRELFSHTPVILLTARSLEQDKLQGFKLGVDDYVTKPFSAEELIARIDNLLKNKLAREAWIAKQTNGKKETVAPLPIEQELIQKAETLVIKNLSNSVYNVETLANEMNYSRRQLVRIIKKLTGLTPLNFIKEIRLQKARNILETRQFATVAEVGFEVGFSDASYFTKAFKKRFGKVPGDFTK